MSEASYTFVMLKLLVHDTAFMHPTSIVVRKVSNNVLIALKSRHS